MSKAVQNCSSNTAAAPNKAPGQTVLLNRSLFMGAIGAVEFAFLFFARALLGGIA